MNPAFQQLTMVNDTLTDRLEVGDRGLAFGDGLFETMRLSNGRIPLLPYHLDRLVDGCVRLAIPVTRSSIELSLDRFKAVLSIPSCILKLTVTRGSGGRGYRPPAAVNTSPSLIWQSLPLLDTTSMAHDGVVLQLCHSPIYPNPLLAGLKHLNRLDYVLAARNLSDDPDVQGLLLDPQDNLLETIHHNLFLVKGGILKTPSLQVSGVKGVMRRLILERLAPAASIPVKEGNLALRDLRAADEAFIANSVRGIWPVRRFQEHKWEGAAPVTRLLQHSVEECLKNGLERDGQP